MFHFYLKIADIDNSGPEVFSVSALEIAEESFRYASSMYKIKAYRVYLGGAPDALPFPYNPVPDKQGPKIQLIAGITSCHTSDRDNHKRKRAAQSDIIIRTAVKLI